MASLSVPLASKKGRRLKVVIVSRISDPTEKRQSDLSLGDQTALAENYLVAQVPEGFDRITIATRGSGEWLDRKELRELERLVESGEIDLVITEDLGRIMRRHQAVAFIEACEDSSVRLIALNDHIDTAIEDWRMKATFASMRHEMYNSDTAKRIRRSMRNRFVQGGILMGLPFGIKAPPGANHDSQLYKADWAQAAVEGMVTRLENGASFAQVADWCNEQQIALGSSARSKRWTACLVSQVIRNPILKGDRVRNRMMTRRVNKTGRRKSVKAPPEELLVRHCSHLIFIEPARYDRLIAMLNQRNGRCRRALKDGNDSRKDVPRRRTEWPGQHLRCGICGRTMYYGGNGIQDHLICTGAEEYRCWNSITADGPRAATLLRATIVAEIQQLPGFDEVVQEQFTQEWRELSTGLAAKKAKLERQRTKVESQLKNVASAIGAAGHSEVLLAQLKQLEGNKADLLADLLDLEQAARNSGPMPDFETIRSTALACLADPKVDPQESANLLRRLIPDLCVYPVRLCDGGHLFAQARFTFTLLPLVDRGLPPEAVPSLTSRELVVTLAELPVRAQIREEVVRQRAADTPKRTIARQLGRYQAEVHRALRLQAKMEELGLTDPIIQVVEPPSDYSKLRRHRHPRYRFEPLPGWPVPKGQ